MNQFVEILQNKFTISLPADLKGGKVVVNDVEIEFDYRPGSVGSPASLILNGICYSVDAIADDDGWVVRTNERDLRATVTDETREKKKVLARSTSGKETGASKIKAPMPGLIIKIEIEKGMLVEKGTGVIIIEAMKMENEIKSTTRGIVSEIGVTSGQSVEKGQHLLTITPS